jgi:trigger factor
LNITTEPLESRQLRLVIAMDEQETQEAMRRAARRISKRANISGFRRGKAPYDLILQRFGEDTVRKEAAEILAEEVYDKALEQEGIEPYASAALEELELDPAITFTFTVPLRPVAELGNYRDYRLKYRQAKVGKKEVQKALENIRMQNAILEFVERPVAMGDGAVIDLVAKVNGEEFIKGDSVHIMVEADNVYPAPGFAEAIVGMAVGDERTFTLTLSDDFPREDLRGREAEFSVKMVEVYDQTIPALNDDLARTVGNFDSLKELEKKVKGQLQQAARQEADQEYAERVLDGILEQAQIEYPPVLLEKELDNAVKEVEQIAKRDAKLSLADYLRLHGKTMEELREELKPGAEARLARALLLGEVARLEGLDVGEEEVRARIAAISAPWGFRSEDVRTSISSDAGLRAVRDHLLANKAILRLVAIAKGEAEAGAGGEASEESEKAGEEA